MQLVFTVTESTPIVYLLMIQEIKQVPKYYHVYLCSYINYKLKSFDATRIHGAEGVKLEYHLIKTTEPHSFPATNSWIFKFIKRFIYVYLSLETVTLYKFCTALRLCGCTTINICVCVSLRYGICNIRRFHTFN